MNDSETPLPVEIVKTFIGNATYVDREMVDAGVALRLLELVRVQHEALEPYAEPPTEAMDSYSCHVGITTKENCGRCGRALKAHAAITSYASLRAELESR